MQKVQEAYQEEMGFDLFNIEKYESNKMSLLYVHMLLTTEVAKVAEEFRQMFKVAENQMNKGMSELQAL
ncbi:hypothetical protein ACQKCU_18505 [Heyndrickxia sporothermodurans]